ncbi:putative zinc finger protein [Halotydeus destructor]|nr:putative zinc finger protein [Halotydeus destructor]
MSSVGDVSCESSIASSDGSLKSTRTIFGCSNCSYRTTRHGNLERHKKSMHSRRSSQIEECCSIQFDNKAQYREHRYSVHSNGYSCEVCLKTFGRRALLRRHMSVHSGEKDHQCDACDYASSHKSNLDRHLKRIHGRDAEPCRPKKRVKMEVEVKSKPEVIEDIAQQPKIRLCKMSYKCSVCETDFQSQYECTLHESDCALIFAAQALVTFKSSCRNFGSN